MCSCDGVRRTTSVFGSLCSRILPDAYSSRLFSPGCFPDGRPAALRDGEWSSGTGSGTVRTEFGPRRADARCSGTGSGILRTEFGAQASTFFETRFSMSRNCEQAPMNEQVLAVLDAPDPWETVSKSP